MEYVDFCSKQMMLRISNKISKEEYEDNIQSEFLRRYDSGYSFTDEDQRYILGKFTNGDIFKHQRYKRAFFKYVFWVNLRCFQIHYVMFGDDGEEDIVITDEIEEVLP